MPMRPGGMPPEERHSLDRHLRMSPLLGNRVTPVPAQLRRGPSRVAGSANAKPG
jgi:hypothetical protein